MENKLNAGLKRRIAGIILVVGIMSVVSAIVFAEEFDIAGTWKGEYGALPPGTPAPAPAPSAGRGGFGGGAGGFGGPQKVVLRAKVNKKDGKASGNITWGSEATTDVREGKVDGNKLTFRTGVNPGPFWNYDASLIGEELVITRAQEGGRGGKPQVVNLKRDK